MKILHINSGLLTNAEVLAVLRDRGCDKAVGGTNRALASEKILYQHLIEQSRLGVPELQSFIDAVEPFGLTRCAPGGHAAKRPTATYETMRALRDLLVDHPHGCMACYDTFAFDFQTIWIRLSSRSLPSLHHSPTDHCLPLQVRDAAAGQPCALVSR